MKKIAYVVALGLALSAHADQKTGQPLFNIAEAAPSVAKVEAPAQADKAPDMQKAPKQSAETQTKQAAPLFSVSNEALDAADKANQDKLVVQKKSATPKKPAAEKPAPTPQSQPAAADKRVAVSLQPERAAEKALEAENKAHEETALFKVASYYEADEMGDSDDAVRKIDFSKPQGQQLPSDVARRKAVEKKVVAERAIAGSKAIRLAAPAVPKKQKGSYSYVVRGKRYQTLASSENFVQEGAASWYGPGFHGRKTASGEIYDMHKLTAAHKRLPLGTKLEVTSKRTGKSVVVTVNDRGPFHGNRILDLSHAAASQLGLVNAGVGEVTIRAIK